MDRVFFLTNVIRGFQPYCKIIFTVKYNCHKRYRKLTFFNISLKNKRIFDIFSKINTENIIIYILFVMKIYKPCLFKHEFFVFGCKLDTHSTFSRKYHHTLVGIKVWE